MMVRRALALGALASIAATAACSDDTTPDDAGGEGAVSLRLYGESFIEDGIPAEEVEDGWAVSFDTFEVTIPDITVSGVSVAPDPASYDIAAFSDGDTIATMTLPAGAHPSAAYTISRVVVRGVATRAQEQKTFDWTFTSSTRYSGCEANISLTDGATASFELTIHADHLLYDSLVSSEPALRFDPYAAADADDDGVISQAELEAASVGALDVGNADVATLWGYLEAQITTLGHANGEGHCDTTAP